MFGLFKKKPNTELEKLKAELAQHRDHQGRADRLFNELKEAEKRIEELEEVVSAQHKEIEELKASKSVKLTDAQAKKQLKALEKQKIKQLEAQLALVPDGAEFHGAAVIYTKRTKKTETVKFDSKKKALAILAKAKRGTIKIVS